jgi:hypothetical protein
VVLKKITSHYFDLHVFQSLALIQCHVFFVFCFVLVCLFIATRAIFQLSGGCHHCRWQGCKFRPMLSTQGLWAGRDLYRATPTATRDLDLYRLIGKTGTHVPQWDSNPRRKDHQIFAPDALTTVPHGQLCVFIIFSSIAINIHCNNVPSGVYPYFLCENLEITALKSLIFGMKIFKLLFE